MASSKRDRVTPPKQRANRDRKVRAKETSMAGEEHTRPESALDPFVKMVQTYWRRLSEVTSLETVQARIADAQRTFAQECAEVAVPAEVKKQAAEAYQAYGRATREATSAEDLQKRAAEAFATVNQSYKEQVTPALVRDRAARASTGYARNVQQALAPEEFQQQVDGAFREYVDALKAAWAGVDAEHLDPQTLAAALQIMGAGVSLRTASLLAARQRWAIASNVTAMASATAAR
jgi:hypothetical protein